MPYLTQTRFPRLWSLFQHWLGGSVDKQRLALLHYPGRGRVLEVGCSTGNLAPAFLRVGAEYTGVDIDPVVIELACRHYAGQRARFLCEDLRRTSLAAERFDYVLLAGVCHHIDDQLCTELIAAASRLLAPGAPLVVTDPLFPRPDDPWAVRQFIRLEQGRWVRSMEQLAGLLARLRELRLAESSEHLVGASPWSLPLVARMGVFRLAAA
jgi:SAM-dependent methyltransferase